jgi:hypothetical protein
MVLALEIKLKPIGLTPIHSRISMCQPWLTQDDIVGRGGEISCQEIHLPVGVRVDLDRSSRNLERCQLGTSMERGEHLNLGGTRRHGELVSTEKRTLHEITSRTGVDEETRWLAGKRALEDDHLRASIDGRQSEEILGGLGAWSASGGGRGARRQGGASRR